MYFKWLVVASVALVSLDYAFGAPLSFKTQNDLTKSFTEFLQQDKAFQTALEHGNLFENGEILARNRRQAEGEFDDAANGDLEPQQPGFFDRAAKFVVELLQRFLKWVNSDSN